MSSPSGTPGTIIGSPPPHTGRGIKKTPPKPAQPSVPGGRKLSALLDQTVRCAWLGLSAVQARTVRCAGSDSAVVRLRLACRASWLGLPGSRSLIFHNQPGVAVEADCSEWAGVDARRYMPPLWLNCNQVGVAGNRDGAGAALIGGGGAVCVGDQESRITAGVDAEAGDDEGAVVSAGGHVCYGNALADFQRRT